MTSSPPARPDRVLKGRAGAPGRAAGPIVRLEAAVAGLEARPSGAGAGAQLETAIEAARRELEEIAASSDADGAAILAFQIALLEDPALAGPAFEAIAGGRGAAEAWRTCIAGEIAAYRASEDETFRARASDLADLALRVESLLAGAGPAREIAHGSILLAEDLGPSQFLALAPRLVGLALEAGSPSSHLAILARGRGLPLVTGLGPVEDAPGYGLVDGDTGELTLADRPLVAGTGRRRPTQVDAEPARTASGERVEVHLNIDLPEAVDDATLAAADGVGLWRTEFLFLGRDRLPDEEEQYAATARLLDRLGGRPLTLRTLDVGGDKPLPGLTLAAERNPFLGLRGLRLTLEHPEVLVPQLRASLRAAAGGRPLRVMLPMVTDPVELEEARRHLARCREQLEAEGSDAGMPALGIMIETPAAALRADAFLVDFLSIGTNDLTQYVTAAARDAGGRVGRLAEPGHPAVLRLVGEVVGAARSAGVPVSVCGDLASDPARVGALLALGLRSLSVAPAALGEVKAAIRAWGGRP